MARAFRVLLDRGHLGLRGGGAVGGRGGQDGRVVDRHPLSGPTGRRPSAGCASGGRCAICPTVAEAWRDGAIGAEAAQAIASARRHRTEASMARDEAMLVSQASELGFEDFSRALAYWKQLADPDGAEASDEERKASRERLFGLELLGHVAGPDDTRPDQRAAIVAGELNRLEHDLFEADCAEAKERLGRAGRASTSWPAPRASAGPTPWWKWPPAAAPPRPRASAPPRSSVSWSASRPSRAHL